MSYDIDKYSNQTDYSLIVKDVEEVEFQDANVKSLIKSSGGLLARIWPSERDKIIQEFQNKKLDAFLSQYYKRLHMAFDAQLKTIRQQYDSYLRRVSTELSQKDANFCMNKLQELSSSVDKIVESMATRCDDAIQHISTIKSDFVREKTLELYQNRYNDDCETIKFLLKQFNDAIKAHVNIPDISFTPPQY